MSEYNRFIARIVTRLRPEAWDAIIPHGPAWASVAGPLPDPWRYLMGPGPQPWHVAGPHPEPWRSPAIRAFDRLSAVGLNPQPLPPEEMFAVAITTSMLTQVVGLGNTADLYGGEAAGNFQRRAHRMLSEWDEICPRWPKWPKNWPPPPDPPGWLGDEMSPAAHFLAAAQVLASSEMVMDESIASALAEIGNRQFEQSLSRMG